MAERRGKKENHDKNAQGNREWQARKRQGRPKQKFVYDNGTHWTGLNCGHWELHSSGNKTSEFATKGEL